MILAFFNSRGFFFRDHLFILKSAKVTPSDYLDDRLILGGLRERVSGTSVSGRAPPPPTFSQAT